MFSQGKRKFTSSLFIATSLLLSVQLAQSVEPYGTRQFTQETLINTNSSNAGNACSSNPCMRGSCFENEKEYHCFCPSGFTGKMCETTLDACSTYPCLRGTCLHHNADYYCVCPSGYTGKNCDSMINSCKSNPCVRGVCYHHQTQFHCVCPEGYYGKRCETDNNDCFSQPCLNGGICLDKIGNFSCQCSSGFAGDRCQTEIDECSPSPCLNGGTCKDGINQYVCQCPRGFGGDRCQNVTDPCRYNPCIRGTCFAHVSQFICECPSGYTGKLCETAITLVLYGPKEVFITLPAGNPMNLNCSISTRYTTWRKIRGCGGPYSSYSNLVYRRSSTTFGDAGTYVCKASDDPAVMKVFHVDITWQKETCNFDDRSLCGWSTQPNNYYSSSIVWKQEQGRSQQSGKEQYNDHTLGTTNGWYMQVDATSQRDHDRTALLTSHNFPANRTICFEFWYRISGHGNAMLAMMLKDSCLKKETELLKLIGDHGQKWNKATVTVLNTFVPNDYNLALKADIRRSFHGTMAVDDLKISAGHCQGSQGLSLVG